MKNTAASCIDHSPEARYSHNIVQARKGRQGDVCQRYVHRRGRWKGVVMHQKLPYLRVILIISASKLKSLGN